MSIHVVRGVVQLSHACHMQYLMHTDGRFMTLSFVFFVCRFIDFTTGIMLMAQSDAHNNSRQQKFMVEPKTATRNNARAPLSVCVASLRRPHQLMPRRLLHSRHEPLQHHHLPLALYPEAVGRSFLHQRIHPPQPFVDALKCTATALVETF